MLSYKEEDNVFVDIYLAYRFDPMKNIGLDICYDKRDRSINVNGNIPTWVSHEVNVKELESFAKNILELVERIKKEDEVPLA